MKTITVGNKCSIDYEGSKVVFNPDSGVMKSSYSYYRFDKSDFKGVDLDNLERPFELQAECVLASNETYEPDDPYSAKPVGGFSNKNWNCKLVKLVKNSE